MNRLQALRNASVINHPKIMPSRDRSEEEKRVTGMYQHLIEELQYILNRVENQRSAVDIRPGLLVELRLEREERERLARGGVGIQAVQEMECPVGIVGRFDAAGDGRVGRHSLTA